MPRRLNTGQRSFWIGALCGAVAASLSDWLWLRRSGARPRLSLVRGKAAKDKADVYRIPLKRDAAGGDPATLAGDRSQSRPRFERAGGAPGGAHPVEVHDVPGHPGQRLDHSDSSHPVCSASRTRIQPPGSDTRS